MPLRVDTHAAAAPIATPPEDSPKNTQAPKALSWPELRIEHPSLPAPAKRVLNAHLRSLGLSPSQKSPHQALADKELQRAQNADPRVKAADMQTAIARGQKAAEMTPTAQRNFFGFTRLIDGKFTLDAQSLEVLAKDAIERVGHADELLGAIDQGPPSGATGWKKPQSRAEVVASLVRHLILGDGASFHLQLSPDLAQWIKSTLKEEGIEVREAMGGAGAFCANIASALPNIQSTFYSSEPVPKRIAERFAPGVRGVEANGKTCSLKDASSDRVQARVNYAAEHNADEAFTILGRSVLKINGQEHPLCTGPAGRIILGTKGTDAPGFELSPTAQKKIARDHDLFFLVGSHYLTKAAPQECRAQAEKLKHDLNTMRAENPDLLVHLQYVVPKAEKNEALLFKTLRGSFKSLSLNSVELAGLLSRLHEAGETDWNGMRHPDRKTAEDPAYVLKAATALMRALDLKRIHVHSMKGDLIITHEVHNPKRQVLASLRSRHLAVMKAANPTGEIKTPLDIWPVTPIIDGENLATVQHFADAMAQRHALDATQRDKIATDWWYQELDGPLTLFVPNHGLHDFQGGTISLGDTIDSTTLFFSRPANAPYRLPHPSQFNR